MASNPEYVLDASAVIAAMFREFGHERVRSVQTRSVIGAVNAAEVILKLVEFGATWEEAKRQLELLPIEVVPFDAAILPGILDGPPKKSGLSLADRACLATARNLKLTALTGDRKWMPFASDEIKIALIRP